MGEYKSETEANHQSQEPEALGKLGDQFCNACMHVQVTCMWLTMGSLKQVCFGCQQTHGKCEICGSSVMARALHQVRVHKRCKVVSRPTIESGDNMMWVLPPAPKVVRKAESLFEKALVGIMKEMKASWNRVFKFS